MGTYRSFIQDMDPLEFYGYFTDFMGFITTDWVITTTEAGANSATEALSTTLRGGWLVTTLDIADNDNDFFQFAGGSGAVVEPFLFVTGKKLRFAMRFKINETLESDFIAGLYITDTSPLDVTDGIYFKKADGDETLTLNVTKNSTTTSIDVGELADDTVYEIEFYYNGATLVAYLDGVRVGKVALTNAPDDENLAIGFGLQAGEATNAKIVSVDYIGAWQER